MMKLMMLGIKKATPGSRFKPTNYYETTIIKH